MAKQEFTLRGRGTATSASLGSGVLLFGLDAGSCEACLEAARRINRFGGPGLCSGSGEAAEGSSECVFGMKFGREFVPDSSMRSE